MTRNDVSKTAFIPGSSIKGAIRTAIGNAFTVQAGVTKSDGKRYDTKIFGRPQQDSMKYLKISDIALNKNSTAFFEAKELSSKETAPPKGSYEAVQSLCNRGESVIYPLRILISSQLNIQKQKVDIPFIIKLLNDFYIPKFNDEYSNFYKPLSINKELDQIACQVASLKKNEALLRVGHFSHVECMTFDNIRDPKTRWNTKTRQNLPWGKTRTLANGLYPFGWAKIEITQDLNFNNRKNFEWPFSIEEINERIEIQEQLKQAKEKRSKQIEKEHRQNQKREAELAAMSPEDREIEELKDQNVVEEKINIAFKKLDQYSEDNKKIAATIIKQYWINNKQWGKKDFSSKKWKKARDKINKIKSILGEE